MPSTRPPIYIHTIHCDPSSNLQFYTANTWKERQEIHVGTFSTVDDCAPYWASHGETTSLMS